MKNKLRIPLVCLALAVAGAIAGQGICFGELLRGLDSYGRWPDMSQRSAAIDPERNLLFIGDGNILMALNTDTLTSVSRLTLDVTTGVRGIVISEDGDTIYAACGRDGIQVIDVSDAETMVIKSVLSKTVKEDAEAEEAAEDPIHAAGISCLGDRVFVADLYFGLRVINVTDPAAPFQESAFEQVSITSEGAIFSGGYENLAASEINGRTCVFVLDKYYGMRVFEITAGRVSHLANYPPTPDITALYDTKPVTDVAILDNRYAIVSDYENGLIFLDLFSNADTPGQFDIAPVSYFETPGSASSISLAENRVYVADGNSGLLIVGISDITKPVTMGTFATGGAHSVIADGPVSFVSDAAKGIQRVSAENPAAPVSTHQFDSPSDADGIFAVSDLIYTVDNDGPEEGLRVIRMKGEGDNVLEGFCKTPGNAERVRIKGNHAYIADGPAGLTVVNVADPAAPQVVFTGAGNPSIDNAVDVYVPAEGNIIYLADATGRILAFDITSPVLPVQISTFTVNDPIFGFSGFHNEDAGYLYTAGPLGLSVVDVTDPIQASVLDLIDTPGDARDVFVLKDYAYVADGAAGLTLMDLTRPDRPETFATRNLAGDCVAVFTDNVYAHCAKGETGVTVIAVSDEPTPRLTLVTEADTPGYARDIFVGGGEAGRFTYVADSSAGLLVFKHNDQYSGGIDEQPFTESTHDRGWDRISCFISTILE